MDIDEVENSVFKIISGISTNDIEIKPSMKFQELCLSSIDIVMMLVELEDHFSIGFDDEDLDYSKYVYVDDIVNKIKTYLNCSKKAIC